MRYTIYKKAPLCLGTNGKRFPNGWGDWLEQRLNMVSAFWKAVFSGNGIFREILFIQRLSGGCKKERMGLCICFEWEC